MATDTANCVLEEEIKRNGSVCYPPCDACLTLLSQAELDRGWILVRPNLSFYLNNHTTYILDNYNVLSQKYFAWGGQTS